MSNGTASEQVAPGWFVEFQMAVLRALPRDIDQETADGWRGNGEALARAFRGILIPQENKGETEKTKSPIQILKFISGGHSLAIDVVDGSKIIAKAKKTFPAGIDSDFVRWSADEPGHPTSEILANVYEMARDATFSQMFGFLSADVSKLFFTQHQIISFVEKYPNWLRTGGFATFLPFVSHGHFFVASVCVGSDVRLSVGVFRFERDYVWFADHHHRVVVPQLA